MGERGDNRGLTGTARGRDTTAAGPWPLDVASALRSGAEALLTILFAPACLACDRSLDTPLSGPICEPCWQTVLLLPSALCDRCGDPFVPAGAVVVKPALCERCSRGEHRITRSRSAGVYDGTLRAAIHGLKYEGRRSLARRLAGIMRHHAGDVLEGADATVPVPLHGSRRRARGFNQASDLARHLGLPVLHALHRTRATTPQADLPATDRVTNVQDAFAASRRMTMWRGAVLVLVDDVSTTGATLDACAAVLLEAGAAEVRAITAARAVKRQP